MIRANATRKDPTRTAVLRSRYARDLRGRFRGLAGLIRKTVVENDAFGISSRRRRSDIIGLQAQPAGRFQFTTDAEKIDAFLVWLNDAIDQNVLEATRGPSGRIDRSNWQSVYVRSAYTSAIRSANVALKAAGIVASDGLQGVFDVPIHAEALSILSTRNFEALRNITTTMSAEIGRALTDGFSKGLGPRQIAKQLNDRVSKIGITRANVLARTEIINVHAESTLNRYEQFGVQTVGAEVEFTTANDPCPVCEKLDGQIYTIKQARGVIPVHPNCRCAWLPVIPTATKPSPKKKEYEIAPNTTKSSVLPRHVDHPSLAGEGRRVDSPGVLAYQVAFEEGRKNKGVRDEIKSKGRDLFFTKKEIRELVKNRAQAARANDDEEVGRLTAKIEELTESVAGKMATVSGLKSRLEASKARIMEAIRPGKAGGLDVPRSIRAKSAGDIQEEYRNAVEWLNNNISTDTFNGLKVRVKFSKRTRRAYSDYDADASGSPHYIQLGPNSISNIVVHEIGHSIESDNRKLAASQLRFLERRTDKEPLVTMNQATGSTAYSRDEVTRPDKFSNPYIGKKYSLADRGSVSENERYANRYFPESVVSDRDGYMFGAEVLSMGLELMYLDPDAFAQADRDHFIWTVNAMNGVFE